jgi:hypothetical protein
MQELLRHFSLRSTLDIYTRAITPAKHAAQAAVVLALVLSSERNDASLCDGRKRGAKRAPKCVLLHPARYLGKKSNIILADGTLLSSAGA